MERIRFVTSIQRRSVVENIGLNNVEQRIIHFYLVLWVREGILAMTIISTSWELTNAWGKFLGSYFAIN